MGSYHNAIMTKLFDTNYLHEIPTDLQINIMDIVEKSIKQDKIDNLNERLEKYTKGICEDDDVLFEATIGESIFFSLFGIQYNVPPNINK